MDHGIGPVHRTHSVSQILYSNINEKESCHPAIFRKPSFLFGCDEHKRTNEVNHGEGDRNETPYPCQINGDGNVRIKITVSPLIVVPRPVLETIIRTVVDSVDIISREEEQSS